jgi:pyruvate,water dikinase
MSEIPESSILEGARVAPGDLAQVGGKAVNLTRLQRFGQTVPPWYAVTTRAFRGTLRESGLDREIARRLDDVAEGDDAAWKNAAEEIQARIRDLEIPAHLAESITRAHDGLIPAGAFVAVRSSATAEDTATDSFAGIHDSFLYIRGREEIFQAIKNVWASAYNERALAYRRARRISLNEISIGVLVQHMIDAKISGVLFSVNPNSGDVHEVVVSSLYGSGEGLVSAGLEADTFVVDKETLEATHDVVEKTEQFVLDEQAGGGLKRIPVPGDLRKRSSLTNEQLQVLTLAGKQIETSFGRPQDVEFCWDEDGRLFILQARPVTTVEEYGPAAGNRLLWDNSNIIESYSGVTSPMTFSFIRHAYTIVYHCFADVMGINRRVVHDSRHTFRNMLGLFRGQVYYNLNNWYRLVRLFPGFNYNKKFMESMMGVRESLSDDSETPAPGWVDRYFVELPALLRLLVRSTYNFIRVRKRVGDFEALFREHYGRWTSIDLSTKAPHELMALYDEMEDKLLWNWKAPIINDFFVMIFYGTLRKLCSSWCGDASGSLQNDLICGEGGIESTEPTKMLLRLAALADRIPELRDLILRGSPEELATGVPTDPRFTEFTESIRSYLDLYGFRCVNELKLEEYSLKDRPAFLYQVIRNYLSLGDRKALDVDAQAERERGIRREAEKRAFDALGRGVIPRRTIFRWVLGNARLGVKNRENMRFARTRIYGLLRELLREMGRKLAVEGLLEEADDIFCLTIDEVWDFIKGTAVTTDLRGLVTVRRGEFEAFRSEQDRMPDDRFETFGMAYHRNRFRGRRAAVEPSGDGVLRGIGCCPGVVTGVVKYVRSPAEDASLSGEILVAERTDPGWVPLYPSVSGLLIERGSILSHSAIVAREMGIPTIVGIPGLTSVLQSGQQVTMDGAAGTVRPADAAADPDRPEPPLDTR